MLVLVVVLVLDVFGLCGEKRNRHRGSCLPLHPLANGFKVQFAFMFAALDHGDAKPGGAFFGISNG